MAQNEHEARDRFGFHRSWIAREFGLRYYVPLQGEDLDALQQVGSIERFEVDAPLFRQGEPAEAAFLITNGEVGLWRDIERPTVQLSTVGNGRVIGDLEMFTEGDYFSTALAIGPVAAIRLEREAVMQLLVEHPRLAIRWLVAALRQFEDSQKRIAQLLGGTAKAKIALFLLDEVDGDRVEITHEKIGDLLGLERATVSRMLQRMRDMGLIETQRGVVVVSDPGGLLDLVTRPWPEDSEDE